MREKIVLTMVLMSLASFSGTTSYGGVGVVSSATRSFLGSPLGGRVLAGISGVPGAKIATMSLEEKVRLFENAFGRTQDPELAEKIEGILLELSRGGGVKAQVHDLLAFLEGYRPNFEISAEDFLAPSVSALREGTGGRDLRGADLQMEDLRGMNLRGANLVRARIYGSDLRGMDLRGANLEQADFNGSALQGANLEGANLRWADLREVNLQGANLQGADLQGALLMEADLAGANLTGADLRGANLAAANLEGVIFIKAIYNRKTRFPNGFDIEGKYLEEDRTRPWGRFFGLFSKKGEFK